MTTIEQTLNELWDVRDKLDALHWEMVRLSKKLATNESTEYLTSNLYVGGIVSNLYNSIEECNSTIDELNEREGEEND